MSIFRLTIILSILATSAFATSVPLSYLSPDGALRAIVIPLGRDAGARKIDNQSDEGIPLEYECRVEIHTRKGRKVWSQDFGSPDHQHGRGVAFALWSPDSNYFAFSTVNSGGHHPWQFFTYAYSRKRNDLHILDRFLGEVVRQKFTFARPNIISLSIYDRDSRGSNEDWPSKKVAVSLTKLLAHRKPEPKELRVDPPIRSPYF